MSFFIAIVVFVLILAILYPKPAASRRSTVYYTALIETTWHEFEAWTTARPHLYTGDCPYGCSLVHRILHALDELEYQGVTIPDALRLKMHLLLTHHAPPDDPPETAGHFH